jgi:hypothetical protein
MTGISKKGKWWALLSHHPKANWAFFQFEGDMMPLATCEYDTRNILPSFNCRGGVLDGSFDMDSRRFEIVVSRGYISQGFWEQFRREDPEQYRWGLSQGRASDPSHPDDLFIEIGKCSPS